MGIYNPPVPNPGAEIKSSDVAEPVLGLANVINGNLDSTNITDGSVTVNELANEAVTIAKLDKGSWQAPDYGSNMGDGANPAGYRRLVNIVIFRGIVQRGTGDMANSNLMFTLPAGYRPPQQVVALGAGSGAAISKVVIGTNGQVIVGATPTATTNYISLDGIRFTLD